IKSEEEKRREVEAQFEGLESAADAADTSETAEPTADTESPLPYTLTGIGEKTVRKLVDAGFGTLEAVTASSVEDLSKIPGIGDKTAEKILTASRGENTAAEGAE